MGKFLNILISKTRYVAGLRCPKLFWCKSNRKDLIPPFDATRQAVVDAGTEVGRLARQLFTDGILVDPGSHHANKTVPATKELLALRKPLFEPGFVHGHAYALIDILVPAGEDEWDLYEVKSSTEVKDEYLDDVAIQRYAVENNGLKLRRCFLVHLNDQYVRQGAFNPEEMFVLADITDETEFRKSTVEGSLLEMVDLVAEDEMPEALIAKRCLKPWGCDMKPVCWEVLPEGDNAMTLFWDKKRGFELVAAGVLTISDIPEGFSLSANQEKQLKVIDSGVPYVDKNRLKEFLSTVQYPLYFFDIETLWPALPLYDGIRPYQHVPFQFSLHVVESPTEEPQHFSFLAEGRGDPRPEFMEKLTNNIGTSGSIIVYNKSFEASRLKECAKALPAYQPIVEDIIERIVDLYAPFRGFMVYHPDQHGAASLKGVLPALTGKGYENMDIQEGGTASNEFYRITFSSVDEEEMQKVRSQLEEYCKLDTEGMIHIVQKLQELSLNGE